MYDDAESPLSLEGAHESNRQVLARARWLNEADTWLQYLMLAHRRAYGYDSACRYYRELLAAVAHIGETLGQDVAWYKRMHDE